MQHKTFIASNDPTSGFLLKADGVRLREMLALLDAIAEGDLLAAAPARAADRNRHKAALSLLSFLTDRLRDLANQLDVEEAPRSCTVVGRAVAAE